MSWISQLGRLILNSFYSPETYAKVSQEGMRRGFLYTLIATVIVMAYTVATVGPGFLSGLSDIKSAAGSIEEKYPGDLRITIQDGVASTNVVEPFYFEQKGLFIGEKVISSEATSSEPKYFLVIDTSHPLTLEEVRAYNSYVVLGQKTMFARQNEGEIRTYDLSNVKEFAIDKEKVGEYVQLAKPWISVGSIVLPIILCIMIGGFTFVFYLICAMLGAIAVLVIARVRKNPLSFSQAVVVSLYTMIPIAIFDAVTDHIGYGNSFTVTAIVFIVIILWNLRTPRPVS